MSIYLNHTEAVREYLQGSLDEILSTRQGIPAGREHDEDLEDNSNLSITIEGAIELFDGHKIEIGAKPYDSQLSHWKITYHNGEETAEGFTHSIQSAIEQAALWFIHGDQTIGDHAAMKAAHIIKMANISMMTGGEECITLTEANFVACQQGKQVLIACNGTEQTTELLNELTRAHALLVTLADHAGQDLIRDFEDEHEHFDLQIARTNIEETLERFIK